MAPGRPASRRTHCALVHVLLAVLVLLLPRPGRAYYVLKLGWAPVFCETPYTYKTEPFCPPVNISAGAATGNPTFNAFRPMRMYAVDANGSTIAYCPDRPTWDPARVPKDLLQELDCTWGSYSVADNNDQLWRLLWDDPTDTGNQPGRCTGLSQEDYMRVMLKLRSKYNLDSVLRSTGALWNSQTAAPVLQDAIAAAFGKEPYIKCIEQRQLKELSSVSLCFDAPPGNATVEQLAAAPELELVNCTHGVPCRDAFVVPLTGKDVTPECAPYYPGVAPLSAPSPQPPPPPSPAPPAPAPPAPAPPALVSVPKPARAPSGGTLPRVPAPSPAVPPAAPPPSPIAPNTSALGTAAEPSTADASGMSTGAVVGIAVGATAAAVAAVAGLLLLRRRQGQAQDRAPGGPKPEAASILAHGGGGGGGSMRSASGRSANGRSFNSSGVGSAAMLHLEHDAAAAAGDVHATFPTRPPGLPPAELASIVSVASDAPPAQLPAFQPGDSPAALEALMRAAAATTARPPPRAASASHAQRIREAAALAGATGVSLPPTPPVPGTLARRASQASSDSPDSPLLPGASFGADAEQDSLLAYLRAQARPHGPRAALERQVSGVDVAPWVTRFGELDIVRPIGQGSFSKVYAARWHETVVAVKVLLAGGAGAVVTPDDAQRALALSAAAVASLEEEASLLASLRHPNICGFLAICYAPPCIVSEFCARGSLADLLGRARGDAAAAAVLAWRRRLGMALDAAAGMLHLHSRPAPIVHRDLKSANLLVDGQYRIKVTDFNLSRILAADQGLAHNSSLAAMNPRWLAPEIMRGERATQASDVFSFAVVMWELLTWDVPWGSTNPWQLVNIVLGGGRLEVPPRERLPGADTAWFGGLDAYVALMRRCWAHAPADRPDFQQVITELRALQEQADAAGGGGTTGQPGDPT